MPNQWTSPQRPRERTPLPLQRQQWYFTLPDGLRVDVTIDWRHVYQQCLVAKGAVRGISFSGPVRVKVPVYQPDVAKRERG